MTAALFAIDGTTAIPLERCRGPWSPDACHGGPVGALLARAAELVETDGIVWQIARLTIELLRPVPMSALEVHSEVARQGRKVSLVEATLTRAADGVEVARARALRIRAETVALPDDPLVRPEAAFTPPSHSRPERSSIPAEGIAFHQDGVEMRVAAGSVVERGPVSVWIRLCQPVVAGEEPTGLQRAAAAADFGNGVSRVLRMEHYRFINPDLTIHLARSPRGEWIGLRAASLLGPRGAGVADTALYDEDGRIGRSSQSLIIEAV
jgi:hypothetical protein